ncbi:alpha/beta fold hydrolase [Antarcticibacterium flavum]|uniref:Alpha/beta fold hydrolase n=1 Tax=Antarcticibacterium flavum TaxID=2058175 RepID=A0A5B7X442_9FLAO|nr:MULTISPECIES: alpha/beta fold hydrolase [Antarcticibacterium]MCM4159111.1 alpha/beta hydrolase [Antarcticibacterium sp. W02-3]QCY69512.1 alpha/beta fold hydrolase [Antarcticibacterium flavum]
MPVIESTYKAPLLFRNYHISTIYASALRKVPRPPFKRERLELEDGDFMDIDWSSAPGKNTRVVIILHGLEGSSNRPYVMGMTNHFNKNGWDVAAVNLRGCSGEMNRLYRSYNAGASEDLEQVIAHILDGNIYSELALTGFSLGGNLMLKYLGEDRKLPKEIKGAVAISAPCDLYKSLLKLQEPQNFIYSRRFVNKLKKQLLLREQKFPGQISTEEIASCRSLYSIDDLYTGKAHGFEGARDYYEKSSALNFIPNIKIPTLLLNATNDAFLSRNSSPEGLAQNNRHFYLETPKHGGHVGFLQNKEETYAEERAVEFINKHAR